MPTNNMKTHKVIKEVTQAQPYNDVEIEPGAQIVDFRGEPWEFVTISKVPQQNGIDYSNGKILVTRPGKSHTDQSQLRELYPSVFDLRIVERDAHPKQDTLLEIADEMLMELVGISKATTSIELIAKCEAWNARIKTLNPDPDEGLPKEPFA